MTPSDRQKRNMGYIVGLSCLLVEVVSMVTYFPQLRIRAWVHVFSILVNAFLVVCGVLLLNKNNLALQNRSDKESSGIKIMVCQEPIARSVHLSY